MTIKMAININNDFLLILLIKKIIFLIEFSLIITKNKMVYSSLLVNIDLYLLRFFGFLKIKSI